MSAIYRSRLVAVLAAAAIALAVVGFAGLVAAHRNDVNHPTTDERTTVQQAAADAVAALMTFSPADDPPRREVVAKLTGRMAAEYRTQGPDLILPNAVESRTSMSAKVIGAAVNSYSTDEARVLVFVDQQVDVPGLTRDNPGGERVTASRWAVMHRHDGVWLLKDLTLVDASGDS
ncbi:hypothetical protein GOEFS_091_00260 [Gordonia effusa NBRC 100432]|uniref:Mce-associated membrane protein n=1 Tax=Gordonia effusa NBRC 100432 TaxID=1077974 RepID=H0R383_9ACTN|nr:hypothetical protein [Gordonia effusa]GAB19534.1 hypothetical protein GOEFS_091_00260 [Gordonia effusa NBRC 100432]